MDDCRNSEKINRLLEFAVRAGATKARCLSPENVRVEERLAAFCKDPKCPDWGQSMSCPPNVSGPAGLRKMLNSAEYVLVFRIEIQASYLHGEVRPEVMRLLHEIAAEIETEAKRLGYRNAAGFAGGSCKESFCREHLSCRVLAEQGQCRHEAHARPSMSGYGVNVGELMKTAGWSSSLDLLNSNDPGEPLSWVAGLVLLF